MTKEKKRGRPRKLSAQTPLSCWLEEHRIERSAFASKLGITTEYLYRLCRNSRRPSLELALKIESVTNGKISSTYWVKTPPHSRD
jgi:DNA-binding XRE family transcriptional regulator